MKRGNKPYSVTFESLVMRLVKHSKDHLENFPSYQFCASWQHEQLEHLLSNVPQLHVCCIHDYSENYSCNYQNEVQLSNYYPQMQASIHGVFFSHWWSWKLTWRQIFTYTFAKNVLQVTSVELVMFWSGVIFFAVCHLQSTELEMWLHRWV